MATRRSDDEFDEDTDPDHPRVRRDNFNQDDPTEEPDNDSNKIVRDFIPDPD